MKFHTVYMGRVFLIAESAVTIPIQVSIYKFRPTINIVVPNPVKVLRSFWRVLRVLHFWLNKGEHKYKQRKYRNNCKKDEHKCSKIFQKYELNIFI